MSDKIDISPGDLPPWLRDFASSSADAELAEMALKAADRIDVLAAPAMTVEEAARVLLRLDEYGNRKAVYDACANRVKVYKFDAVLRALAGEGKP